MPRRLSASVAGLLAAFAVNGAAPAASAEAAAGGVTQLAAGWDRDGVAIAARPAAGPQRLDAQYEDFEARFAVECRGGCRGGLLLGAPDNSRFVLIPLSDDGRGAYQATLDKGKVVKGQPLDGAPNPFLGSPALIAPRLGDKARPASASAPAKVGGAAVDPSPDGWHDVLVTRRAGIISVRIDGRSLGGGYWMPAKFGVASLSLLSDSTAAIRYRFAGVRDLIAQSVAPEHIASRFKKKQLSAMFLTEAVASGDFNRDGKPDLVAGPHIYFGPDFVRRTRLYPERPAGPATYQSSMVQFGHDFTGDGWDDVLELGLPGQGAILLVNPQGASRYWDAHTVIPAVSSEIASLADIDGDGKAELIFSQSAPGGPPRSVRIAYAKPDPQDPTKPWLVTGVSAPGNWTAHGIGVGDVDGDGRADILNGRQWWSAPATAGGEWRAHDAYFGEGASIIVDDLNGDGLADVISSLDAHGWGLAWFEGQRGPGGKITHIRHMIMGDDRDPVAKLVFSELHSLAYADIDGDGRKDIVSGKRWWAHLDSELDPDAYGEQVLYAFRQTGRKARVAFEPLLISNRSGAGTQIVAQDLDGDGKVDIAATSRLGTFLFHTGK